ncbi:hypothetical protein CO726_09785 [Bacillus fungorum]|uniref:TniQ domain-containing protein n=1 Tax=Bacillus fungorum TaxID=2039284 RepID=A0A2G6QFH8_9BACI|nr:TniQ family protein [Bacillus fungorum]PIE95583.1 hypothetical protein CO726_09785 [Bacillus fungorum]
MKHSIIKEKADEIILSQRSLLYGLEPLERGNVQVECLSSYICRLACAHNISVGALFTEYIYPRMQSYSYFKKNINHQKLLDGSTVNHIGTIAQNLIDIIESLTDIKRLDEISLLNWNGILNKRSAIINSKKRWCPNCISEWALNHKPIYEPLLWHLKELKICSIHKMPLQDECDECGRTSPYFTAKIKLGFCSYCNAFLGQEHIKRNKESLTNREKYFLSGYSELLTMNHSINGFPTTHSVRKFFKYLKENNHKISFKAFSDNLNAFNNKRIGTWFANQHLPPLEFWSRISEITNIPIHSLLMEKNNYDVLMPYLQRKTRKKVEPWPDIENTQQILLDYIKKDNNSLNFTEVAESLGLNRKSVEYHFPELISIIVERNKLYRDNERDFNQERIKLKLENILKDPFMNKISLKKTLMLLEVSYKVARRLYPELCDEIIKRHKIYKTKVKNERIKRDKTDIKEIIYSYHNRGVYPSDTLICKVFPRAIIFKQKYYRDFRNEVRKELGYDL